MGSETRLVIGQHALASIFEHCMEERPYEACGILTGRDGLVLHAFATDNVRQSPVFYEVDATQQERILLGMGERGETLLAIYHSHPTASATPSQNDINMAVHYPDALRMIVSLAGPTAEVKSYRVAHGVAVEVPIRSVADLSSVWHDVRGDRRPEATG